MSKVPRITRLPKPRGKGADAEAGVVADIWLATQIISVLLSQLCGVLFILIRYILVFDLSEGSSTHFAAISFYCLGGNIYEKHSIFRSCYGYCNPS